MRELKTIYGHFLLLGFPSEFWKTLKYFGSAKSHLESQRILPDEPTIDACVVAGLSLLRNMRLMTMEESLLSAESAVVGTCFT
jgi:hypothetical protein